MLSRRFFFFLPLCYEIGQTDGRKDQDWPGRQGESLRPQCSSHWKLRPRSEGGLWLSRLDDIGKLRHARGKGETRAFSNAGWSAGKKGNLLPGPVEKLPKSFPWNLCPSPNRDCASGLLSPTMAQWMVPTTVVAYAESCSLSPPFSISSLAPSFEVGPSTKKFNLSEEPLLALWLALAFAFEAYYIPRKEGDGQEGFKRSRGAACV